MIGDPASAPRRADLQFLRRRFRPRTAPVAPPVMNSPSQPASALGEFISGGARPATPGHPAGSSVGTSPPVGSSSPAAPPSSISFDRPDRNRGSVASLDLDATDDAGAPAPIARPAPAASSSSLDLDEGGPVRSGPASVSPARQVAAAQRELRGHRVSSGQQVLMGPADPTVVLTRVQSGIGQLEFEAACAPDVGDLRLGAAYQLRSGPTSTVQLAGGNRFAPSSRRPVVVAGRDEYEHLRVDLRQVGDLERLAVYAFSESRAELRWGGTLVASTSAGGRVEIPLEGVYPGRVAVLTTLYNVDGQLVLRAELETIAGDIREAARAYGFDHITWRDDRTPVG